MNENSIKTDALERRKWIRAYNTFLQDMEKDLLMKQSPLKLSIHMEVTDLGGVEEHPHDALVH
jgi:hypothetical protein